MMYSNKISVYQHEYIIRAKERIEKIKERALMVRDKENKVVIGWIPGHKGVKGNEIADSQQKKHL